MHGLAPPPSAGFISFESKINKATRNATRLEMKNPTQGNVIIQGVFSFKASHRWNEIPQLIISVFWRTNYTNIHLLMLTH